MILLVFLSILKPPMRKTLISFNNKENKGVVSKMCLVADFVVPPHTGSFLRYQITLTRSKMQAKTDSFFVVFSAVPKMSQTSKSHFYTVYACLKHTYSTLIPHLFHTF